ncbi:MAG: glutamate racemase, partial [Erysipelotrichaceae bacterium]|nr:glutamate racemase [Erysipelotrichaceae bacterium]
MTKRYIGVMDSGLGGLTVVENIRKLMPEEDILFFADTKNLPYGEKTKEELRKIADENTAYLASCPLKALVIACNTMDSTAKDVIVERAGVPVYGVISYAAKKAVSLTKKKNIGVIATRAAVRSGAYRKMIRNADPSVEVHQKACPLLVPMIEDGSYRDHEKAQRILKQYLLPLKKKGIDTLILGCTHYPLLREEIEEILPDVTIVSSSYEVVEALTEVLPERNTRKGRDSYLISSDPVSFSRKAADIAGR